MRPSSDLLDVDLGFRAGPPPSRPKVSASTRATTDAVLDAERSRHDQLVVARVRVVLAAAMVSLDAGQRPDAVVRRAQNLLEGVLR
ncbi:MAG: hypothetical protein U0Q07_01640 [Acidimicrobiales bacterium]